MISVIIIDFNSISMTVQYIKNFIDNTLEKTGLHFIIVDNYVNSKSDIYLKEYFSIYRIERTQLGEILRIEFAGNEIIYYCYGYNGGFAKGNNQGFQIQKELYDDEIVIFSNSDIKLMREINIQQIRSVFNDFPDVAVIGPDVMRPDGIRQSPHRKVSAFSRLIKYYWELVFPFTEVKGDYDYSDTSKKCYWVSGCFMIVNASRFEEAHGFDENTFLYGEEMILAERLLKCGYTEYYFNELSIIHENGGTVRNYNSIEKSEKLCFASLCYYYLKYRDASEIMIKVAKINFDICMKLLRIKTKVRRK